MNGLLHFCSPALLARLAGGHAHGVALLAAQQIEREIRALDPLQSLIIRWRFGVGCDALARREVARKLDLSVKHVRQIEECALMQLGFALLCFGSETTDEVAA